MEIDITRFVTDSDPFEFSASIAERGKNAGRDTWRNAVKEGMASPLLVTEEQIDALRSYVKGFGGWDDSEIAAWSNEECNALFIQCISGDMREAGIDDCNLEDFDWTEYQHDSEKGRVSGRIYRGDDDRIYYYLGE